MAQFNSAKQVQASLSTLFCSHKTRLNLDSSIVVAGHDPVQLELDLTAFSIDRSIHTTILQFDGQTTRPSLRFFDLKQSLDR